MTLRFAIQFIAQSGDRSEKNESSIMWK